MQDDDAPEFIDAIITEMNDHVYMKDWELILKTVVPTGRKVLQLV